MSYNDDFNKNASGVYDGTATKAMRNVTREENRAQRRTKRGYDHPYDAEEARLCKFLKMVFAMAEFAGYHIENRIEVKDLSTGKIWK